MPATLTLPQTPGLLLGREPKRRVRSSMALIAVGVSVVFSLIQHAEVLLGLIDPDESRILTVCYLGWHLAYYLAVRSGLSERLNPADPSLTAPAITMGMVFVSWSYAITGPARGSIMGIMILVILFSMFSLKPQVAWRLAAFGMLCLAVVMLGRAWLTPERYEPRVEAVHFVFALITLGATAALAVRLGALRARLSQQRADLQEALALNRELATRDALTGLLNRRAMTELLAREHPRIERGQGPLCVALLDIDWFKRINDGHGHAVGDAVLQRFAQLLARLRAVVAAGGFDALSPGLAVSFSAGLVACGPGEAQEAAIDRADRALYRAKQAGRNRVEQG